VSTLVILAISWADMRHNAEAGASLEPRVVALEIIEAADVERWKALNQRMDKQDAMLEKLAK
jgi:hypothetical protein